MSGPMVGFFDPVERRAADQKRAFKYPPAISPELAPWSQILDRVVTEFDLDRYPKATLDNALELFEEVHDRAADHANPGDFQEIYDRTMTLAGWDS